MEWVMTRRLLFMQVFEVNAVKKAIRACIFLLVLIVLLYSIQSLLGAKWGINSSGARETTNAIGFYQEPTNTIDVLLVGSSNVFWGTSPLTMYEEYGFTGYTRGSANQPIMLTYYTILDSLRVQNPKVIVLETDEMLKKFDPIGVEYSARRALDYMQLTKIKLAAIRDLPIDGSEQTRISYVFPLLRYHGRWKELDEEDYSYFSWERHNYLKGQYPGVGIFDFHWPEGFMTPSTAVADIPKDNVEYLERIAALCEERGIGLVLIETPNGTWNYAKHNAVQTVADRLGLLYLDYNLPEMIQATGIIDQEDFNANQWHLRITGADKLSKHLGAFIVSAYTLPDHRGEKGYEQWDKDLAAYNEFKAEKINQPTAKANATPQPTTIKLADPVLGSFANVEEGILINWVAIENAQSYAVFRREPNGDWTTLGRSDSTMFLDETAEFGRPYLYTVKAIKDTTVSYCDPNGLLAIRIAEPEILEITAEPGNVHLSWMAADGATAYAILRKDTDMDWETVGLTDCLHYFDMTVESGKTYIYAVQGVKRGCYSAYNRNGQSVTVP